MIELSEKQIKRFWAKVEIKCEDKCWNWTSFKIQRGYGRICLSSKNKKHKNILVHRLAYYLHYGVDPGELCVCHTCDNPSCCNPKHLWLGTYSDNNNDKITKGRHNNPKGSDHFNSKLTEDQIIAIRNDTRKVLIIAKDYNVHISNIYRIKKLKYWKHVV